jgi:hypothetical protein
MQVCASMPSWLILLGLAANTACATHDGDASNAERQANAGIIRGAASPSSQNAVVFLAQVGNDYGGCTGTLVAANLVLTARHCIARVSNRPFKCDESGQLTGVGGRFQGDLPPDAIRIYVGAPRPNVPDPTVQPTARSKAFIHDDGATVCGHDLAFLVLDHDIERAAMLPIRLDAFPQPKETITAVGYGLTEPAANGTSTPPSYRLARSGIDLIRVGPALAGPNELAVPPGEFQVGEAICNGDSGGPAIAESTGAVIGVVSRVENTDSQAKFVCAGSRVHGFYASTASFKEVALQAFAAAGKQPWLEGRVAPSPSGLGNDAGSTAPGR